MGSTRAADHGKRGPLGRHHPQAIIDSGKPRNYVATGGGKRLDFEQEAVDLWERVCEIQQNGSDSPSPK